MEEIKSTVEHLQDLIDAREDMKTSINNKGVQVSGGLKSYADAIDRIPQNVIDGDDLNVGDINVEYTKNGSYNINPVDYELDALSGVGVNVNVPTKKVGMNATPIEITENGIGFYKAKDYSDYDGLSTVSIKVDVPKDVNVGTGNVEYTENGSYTVNASDYNVDALSSVDVTVNVPIKTVGIPPLPLLITNNGSKTIDASDYNVDGLSRVELEINVPQSGGNDLNVGDINVEYTDNGSYNINPIDYELDVLSGVDVTVNVPIKKVGTPPLPLLITNNGSKTINASDYNVDGLSQVELEINVPQSGGDGGNYEIDFTRIGYSLEESKIANEANVICINNAIKRLDTRRPEYLLDSWGGEHTNYNNWSFVDPDKPNNGQTGFRFSPWINDDEVVITPPIYNLNSDGRLVNSSYSENGRIGIFSNASALRYISPFDTSNVTDMRYMFYDCVSLATIPLLDTSNVTNMREMFSGCTSLVTISQLDTSNVTDMRYMFYDCISLATIPLLNTSNVTNMRNMFNGCKFLNSIPQLDTSNVTDMGTMFYSCHKLTTIPQLDTSNVTNMYCMFYLCTSLTSIPQLDTSNVTNMGSMFYSCWRLTSIPQLDTSNVTDMRYMFRECNILTTIPQLDTSNVTDMFDMFYSCNKLTTIPQLDTSNVTDAGRMFDGCTSLENVGGFKGLKVSLNLGDCPKLTLDSFENIVNNVSTILSGKTLTVNETAASNWESEDSTRAYNLIEILMNKGWNLKF